MNRSEKAMVGVGAFVSALVGLNGFADSSVWVQLGVTLSCAMVWGAAMGLVRGWRG